MDLRASIFSFIPSNDERLVDSALMVAFAMEHYTVTGWVESVAVYIVPVSSVREFMDTMATLETTYEYSSPKKNIRR